ncbi:SNF-related serine/threonine-protein kinase isoform X1 [Lucilia cuprina]|uniref:SNF-related serine/threonine-protein kinase isoform X1 n=1 Tax=Lucilia cuprina TaxID=7375 RepID=UPI001F065A35|nr:SNF-related serine/threonine-protein kinase isoform X1 [Lucilia cuprina]XP_046809430.1 SNF-related serine/threonine-protein kinase isoform X1 [Lucilia cuprina]
MQHQHPRTLEASAAAHTSGGASYDGKIAGLYDLEETLGSGHFAVVKLARHVFTGAKVAVKVVDKTKLDEVSKAHLFQEVRCMKLVQHPHVVRLYEVIDTQTKLYLVLELGDGGDLYDYIMKHDGGLSEHLARKYFRQILRAITYCHQLHVVHRDLKPENVVFFEKLGVVKLTDFGFSNKFSPGQKLETFCGSLAYSAPEILLGDSYDAPAVDIWSLGVILYMLVCGQPPFEKANDSETLTMIMDCKYSVPPQISPTCRKLIASMLVRDPKKRATLEQIASDDWVKENPEGDNVDYLPLISREQLSEEDHAFIIQKMINGNIAPKEDILQALDKDKYNHITATYFLLAEMRLRKRREEQHLKQNPHLALGKKNVIGGVGRAQVPDKKAKPLEGGKQMVVPINIVCAPEPIQNEIKTDKRTRKCSIVREEDEEESSHELSCDGNELKVAITRRESISDGRLNRSVQEKCSNVVTAVGTGNKGGGDMDTDADMDTQTKMVVSVDAALAQKLKQIEKDTTNEDREAQLPCEALDKSLEMQDTLRGLKELEIGKLKHLPGKNPVLTHRRHTKLNKIRTPSCSSSEASDDDTKSRSKKKMHKLVGDTPTRFRMHRRDSHDDSSDSQDQGFPTAGHHGGHDLIATSNVSNKKEGQNQQNKSESDTRNKSSHTHHSHQHQHSSHKHKYKQQQAHQTKDSLEKHNSLAEKKQQQNVRRRRIRESQSLDRITEAQEYEMRHQHHHHRLSYSETERYTYEQRNSLFNLHTFPETKEEECDDYDNGGENNSDFANQAEQLRNSLNTLKIHGGSSGVCSVGSGGDDSTTNSNTSSLKSSHTHSSASSIYKLNSIEEIDLILKEKSLTKTIQATSSKCFVTIRKIRKLGKYFPVVNFS